MSSHDAVIDAGAGLVSARHAARQPWRVLATLSALMAFASISTDIYLPALPTMTVALHTDSGWMDFTVSGFLIGFSLGQLMWGPVSDRYGRRLPVALGLVLFVIGSIGCALSGDAMTMIGWRIVQAVGACAGVVLARAMVRDLYQGPRAAQMMSTLMTVMAIAPLVGPIAGAQVLGLFGWRAIFWLLAIIALVTLWALLMLPETLPAAKRNHEPILRAFARYGELIRHRRILAYAGAGAFFYGGIYAYIAGTPFAYISYHHVSETAYALLFSASIIGIMLSNTVNSRLVMRLGSDRMLRIGAGLAALSGVVAALDAYTNTGGLVGLVLPLLVFAGANGFIVANSIAGALSGYPERAGAVSALTGAIHYGAGIFGSALVGLLADGTPWPMGAVIAVSGVGCLASTLLLPRRSVVG